ncbi:MAG: YebC/PmpR family DNA-binding transcriptional regulator [Bacillota bacterium]|nr:YebC/PmpR family DNA-binding transcriptional regulator [Bacillota bacterium]
MSGHSKWANIKRKKGANDAERGKIFTKIAKEIQVAVRAGGPDPDGNFRLKMCIQKAKANNMPADNINRCIQKAAGAGTDGAAIEEFFYEGYGAGGVAVLCDMMTDNRTRAAAEIRYLFSRNNGNLGESGCVSYMFERKGEIAVDAAGVDEDELMMAALDAGAEDMSVDEERATIVTAPGDVEAVQQALSEAGFTVIESQVVMSPSNTIEITDLETAEKVIKLISALEDNDDVREVYANYDIADAIIEQME